MPASTLSGMYCQGLEGLAALKGLTNANSGSDSSVAAIGTADGLTLHQEMYLYVEKIGMTPMQAIQSATSVTARCFRMHDRGRIAAGCRADLLLVRGNPLENISATLDIQGVWREGHQLERRTLA